MRLAIVFSFLLFFNYAQAQFQWGMRSGFQLSTIQHFSPNDGGAMDWRSKYLIPSFYFHWQLDKNFSLSTELAYTSKGASFRFPPESGRSSIVLPYISVPVLVNYEVGKFSFFAGPEIAFKLKSSIKNGQSRVEYQQINYPIDLGITGGTGYKISDTHMVSLRYTHGILNVISPDFAFNFPGMPSEPLRDLGFGYRNRAFQLSLSTRFTYNGENESKRKLSFGLRQGLSRNSLFVVHSTGESTYETLKENTYEAALEMNVGIKKYFQFNTGVSYQTKRTAKTPYAVKFDYLTVPLIFGVSPIVTKDFRFSVQGGLGVNFMVNDENEYERHYTSSDETNKIHTSFIYGFETQIPLKEKVSLLMVYRNSWDNDGPIIFYGDEYKFRGYTISAGLRYHLNSETAEEKANEQLPENQSAFGLKAGINFSWISTKDTPEYLVINQNSSLPFLHGGVFYSIRLNDRIALTPEITLMRRTKELSSIDLPLTLGVRVADRLTLEAGPQVSFFWEQPRLEAGGPYELYVSRLSDIGITGGARYQAFRSCGFGARYFHGMTDGVGLLSSMGEPLSFEAFNRMILLSTYVTIARKK